MIEVRNLRKTFPHRTVEGKNVEKVELLPYKTMGEVKYKKLGLKYRLAGLKEMNETECKRLEKLLITKLGA